jgi:hypothetical protein
MKPTLACALFLLLSCPVFAATYECEGEGDLSVEVVSRKEIIIRLKNAGSEIVADYSGRAEIESLPGALNFRPSDPEEPLYNHSSMISVTVGPWILNGAAGSANGGPDLLVKYEGLETAGSNSYSCKLREN